MIIEHFEIENLFGFHGKSVFNLTPDGQRNVVVVHGRNGLGKTSFLRCLKLLFGGVTDELRREAGEAGRTPSVKQYVLGSSRSSPVQWAGILNSQADRHSARFRVKATIVRDAQRLELEREWIMEADSYAVQRRVAREGRIDRGKKADRLFNQLLPKGYIPYFFFDGELVQDLTTNRHSLKEHARHLFEFAPLEQLDAELGKLSNTYNKNAAKEAASFELKKSHREQAELADVQSVLREQSKDLERELDDLGDRHKQLKEELNQLGDGQLTQERSDAQSRLETAELEEEQAIRDIWDGFTAHAAFICNTDWVSAALAEISEAKSTVEGAATDVITDLLQWLPDRVFAPAPYSRAELRLNTNQVEYYRQRLEDGLRESIPASDVRQYQLIPAAKHRLNQRLTSYEAADDARRRWRRRIREVDQRRAQARDLEAQLEMLSDLSEEDHIRRLELAEQRDQCAQRIGEIGARLKSIKEELKSNRRSQADLVAKIATQEAEVLARSLNRMRRDEVDRQRSFLKAFLKAAHAARRGAVERLANERFRDLFDSHSLIDRIQVTNSFDWRSLGSDKSSVHSGSVSAGMKQLLAFSLLWAMTEAARRDMPIAIDTPLARLDKQHQTNIIERYLPHVSRQVILLPTDSELTPDLHARLRQYIAREYALVNETGNQAGREERSMYAESA